MTPEMVVAIGQEAMEVMVLIALPLLLTVLLVGLLVSMFQAATQINEMTLTFVPKLLVVLFMLIFAGNWMLGLLVDYTRRLIESIPTLIG